MLSESFGTAARRSERVLLRIPIRVVGNDTHGNAFDETTHTLVVNRSGALIAVAHLLHPGAVIKIKNLNTQISCSFLVVMRAAGSLSGTPEWGVKCLAPELEIWGVHFPERSKGAAEADLTHVLLECRECSSREMAAVTVEQYRKLEAQERLPRPCRICGVVSDWNFVVTEVGLGGASPSLPVPSASGLTPQHKPDRRLDQTLAVKLPLEVRRPDGSEETTRTENISGSSLCFACDLEMQIGDRMYVTVGLDPPAEKRDIPARILWRSTAQVKGRAYYRAKLENANDAAAASYGPSA